MPYYAVKIGRKKGIFLSWDECAEQVNGFKGSIYKKFNNEEDARAFLGENPKKKDGVPKRDKKTTCMEENKEMSDYIFYVDGSYNSKKEIAGYGLVLVHKNTIVLRDIGGTHVKENTESRNVLGEIKGAIKALDLAVANGYKEITICYDYLGIENWITGKWKASAEISKYYVELFSLRSKYVKVNFKKIKAHSGDKLNEEADRLAKIGAGF